jgi:hypothetical protein
VCKELEPPLTDYGNGHLAACHHPLNVDSATLAAAQAAAETPRSAAEEALPEDSSGRSDPVRGDSGDPNRDPEPEGGRIPDRPR